MNEQLQFNVPSYVTIVRLQETTDGDCCYVAFHPELPNIMSQGETPEEARENLVEATELAISHLTSNDLPIPEPMPLELTNVGNISAATAFGLSGPLPISFEFVSTESSAAPPSTTQERELSTASFFAP
jgi:predicted RNase H-like HicB family nuclease